MTQFEIHAPLKSFTGQVAGVAFQSGTALVEDTNDAGRSALAYFHRAGYRVDQAPVSDGESAAQTQTPGTGEDDPAQAFDPAGHKADDVVAYLAEATYEEAVRVLDAEASDDGKQRVTITGKREEILADKTPTTPASADDDQKGPQA